jgi:flagellar protein FlaG
MAMEITPVLQGNGTAVRPEIAQQQIEAARQVSDELAAQTQQRQSVSRAELRRYVDELSNVSRAFNHKLSFSYHDGLDQMIVKVIDRDTDKVIKELPPKELQRVHMRIREAIGLLIDESV